MNKYASHTESIKIKQVYQSIPKQLGRDNNRFGYKVISEKGKKAVYGTSIDWLLANNLLHRATLVDVPRIPLKTYHKEHMFKMYMGDVGLLTEMADMTPYDLYSDDGKLFTGMITENYIAQTLCAFWPSIILLDLWKYGKSRFFSDNKRTSDSYRSKSINKYKIKSA